jgi:excinuclease ABC subunit C
MVDSALDAIVGLGPVKKKALLAKFGSLKKIKLANSAQLMEVAGIGPKQAAEILSKLAEIDSDDSGFNATTGEIIK